MHSSEDGHLCSYHVLAIVNSAAVDIKVHASFWIIILSRYMSGSGTAVSYARCTFIFWGTSTPFFLAVVPIYIPTNMIGGFSFLICRLFDDGYSDWCEVRPHCSFYVHFSHNYLHLASFMCFLETILSLEECVFRSSAHFSKDCLFC